MTGASYYSVVTALLFEFFHFFFLQFQKIISFFFCILNWQDIVSKPMSLSSAICELGSLQRNNDLAGPSTSSMVPNGRGGVRGFRSIQPPTVGTDGIYTFHPSTKLHVNLNPRYISKVRTIKLIPCHSHIEFHSFHFSYIV